MDKEKNAIADMVSNMTDEELEHIYELAKKNMGDEKITLDIFCPTNTAKWWESLNKRERDGTQLLFSRFFSTLIRSAAVTDGPDFNLRCMVALAILKGDITVANRSMEDAEYDAPDGGNNNENTDKKTFH